MRFLTCLGLCRSIPNDLVGHLKEHFVNIATRLGRTLEELQTVLLRELLAALRRNYAIGQVYFVSDEDFGDARAGVRLNLLEPVRDIVKCGLLGAVVDEDDAHGALVIRLRDRAEALLSRRVPHLQLHSLVLHIYRFDLEVDS